MLKQIFIDFLKKKDEIVFYRTSIRLMEEVDWKEVNEMHDVVFDNWANSLLFRYELTTHIE